MKLDLPVEVPVLDSLSLAAGDALLVVDVQRDFLPGGALAVPGGDQIVPGINELGGKFKRAGLPVVLTQDWHPSDHLSFASNHEGKRPGDAYQSEGIGPVLWPDHCLQGSPGAAFAADLDPTLGDAIIRKGSNPKVDSYSAFQDQNGLQETGLRGYLSSLGVKRVHVVGLALDYCCYFSVVDAVDAGFEAVLVLDLTKGIDQPPGHLAGALETMKDRGVKFALLGSYSFPPQPNQKNP
ncbi:MAG: bifunctional nicotinamidase/pyrazinamidase [Promethearchaeota archaeon]